MQPHLRATVIGLSSILLWGLSAQIVNWTKELPAFQTMAIGFFTASLLLMAIGRVQTGGFGFVRQPWHYYAIVVALIFVNNAGYVFGLRMAPIVTANLINYLWPLFLILLSVPMLKRPLRVPQAIGALLAFGGCLALMLEGKALAFSFERLPGYLFALTAAVSWAVYSLILKRHYQGVATAALGPVFMAVALMCLMMFPFSVKPWRMPDGEEWMALLASGIGTYGLAYACWDYGAKAGNIRVMSVASYLTPLLSTALLGIVGGVDVPSTAWMSCVLIISGALIAGWREFFGRTPQEPIKMEPS